MVKKSLKFISVYIFCFITLEHGANLGHIKQSNLKIQNVNLVGYDVSLEKCKSVYYWEHRKDKVRKTIQKFYMMYVRS